MNSHQRRKGKRIRKALLDQMGMTPEQWQHLWDNPVVERMAAEIELQEDFRVVAELAKVYPDAGIIQRYKKKHRLSDTQAKLLGHNL